MKASSFTHIGLAIALLVGLCTSAPRAQSFGASGNPIWTGVVSSTAATGSSPIMPFAGHATCSVVAFGSNASPISLTVYGTAQVNPNAGSQWFPNPNFGTAGVIAVANVPATTTGNVANYPGGLYFSWAGNTGTLTAYATCSTATVASSGGSGGTQNVVLTGPTTAPGSSPAPPGTVANGYGANGPASNLICAHQAMAQQTPPTATAVSTLVIPLVAGKAIYVCSYILENAGSGIGGLYYSPSNTCPLPYSTAPLAATFGNTALTGGTGVGIVFFAPAGNAICLQSNSTIPSQSFVTLMFEQFFRALTAQEIEAYCTVPKRCGLYRLFQHLNGVLDHALVP